MDMDQANVSKQPSDVGINLEFYSQRRQGLG